MAKHVAIKCTYNNGDEGILVGFNGTCSEDIIKQNIENGRVWCSQKNCECRKYYDRGFKGKCPIDPCMESELFRDWEFGAGTNHTGKRANTPKHILYVGKGKIAILTTRFPDDEEEDRKIIGFFKIAQVINNPNEETRMIAEKYFRLRLPLDEAKDLYFWDYYSNSEKPKSIRLGCGLTRYLDDNVMATILLDIKQTIRDEKSKEMISKLLNEDFKNVLNLKPSGPRIRKSGNRTKRISTIRKYGTGGEGVDHKKLKEWVAKNPKEIGLNNVKRTEIEYVFTSGDQVDILFELEGKRYAVVEIETFNPFPGCYQALKYKVLKCAELDVNINSLNVESILVAWSTSPEVRRFCNKYGIRFVKKKL